MTHTNSTFSSIFTQFCSLFTISLCILFNLLIVISGDSLAFGLIAIIQLFVKFPGDSLSPIFKNIDLNQVTKLNGKFKSNSKFEDIISNEIISKYCKG